MKVLTIDGSGEVAELGTLNPGMRYIFSFATDLTLIGGTLGLRELSPLSSPVDFFADIAGTTPITWDLSAVSSGRMEFTASTADYLLYVEGSTIGETFEYIIREVI